MDKKWYDNAVVYQIYPQSFMDANGDGVGDLEGIIRKLDYLNDGTKNSLGVDAIWLNPIYSSPRKDFGYDISDYYDMDPIFGDFKTFDLLISEAHNRGIKVLMDFVPNHTSKEHAWFTESRSSVDNPKRNWYIWRDGKDGGPPNNWLSVFGGPAWEYDKKTAQYYMHSFLTDQPDLNWRNEDVRNEMLNIIRFWVGHGVDGFRTDAIYYLVKDEAFRDDPPNPNYNASRDEPYNSLLHTRSSGGPGLAEIADTVCSVIDETENKFMVSESYISIPEMAKLYRACKNKLHAPLNFNFIGLPWSAVEYKKMVDDFDSSLKIGEIPNYVLGNHDRARVASRVGERRARLLAMMLLTLRGMSFLYYGEELGMRDAKIPSESCSDPWEKNVPGFQFCRDKERTPMQWDDSKYAGFSTTKPWLPFFDRPSKRNVEKESRDHSSMLSLYRALIHLKKNSAALKYGAYKPIESKNENVFAFGRGHSGEKILVMLNFGDKEEKARCRIKKAKMVLSSKLNQKTGETYILDEFILRPYEGYIFKY